MELNRQRRRFLRASMLALPALAFPGWAAAAARLTESPRRAAFYHTHTSEKLDIVYSEHGEYVHGALDEINHLLRDFRSGEVHPVDPALLDILHVLRSAAGSSARYEVISGYRSPSTNEMLARRSGGVATHSLHLTGKAIDVRLPGVRTAQLRKAALRLEAGGVGYYPGSDFVHLDTGRVRFW